MRRRADANANPAIHHRGSSGGAEFGGSSRGGSVGRTSSGTTSVPSSRLGNESGTSRGARLGFFLKLHLLDRFWRPSSDQASACLSEVMRDLRRPCPSFRTPRRQN